MATDIDREELERRYEKAAEFAQRRETLQSWGEATAQAVQRGITLASFALVKAHRSDIQFFNELLLESRLTRHGVRETFLPDNMVIVHSEPVEADESLDLTALAIRPVLVLDYPFGESVRKDYEQNQSISRQLKVPYYLVFQSDSHEMVLYRHNGRKYVSVKPNEHDRFAITDLELEVALHDSWVRFWFRGELLPLPDELLRQRNEEHRARLAAEEEVARLRAELERTRRSRNGKK